MSAKNQIAGIYSDIEIQKITTKEKIAALSLFTQRKISSLRRDFGRRFGELFMAIPDPTAPAKTLVLQDISFSSRVMFSFRLRRGFKKYDLIPIVFSANLSKYLMKPAAPQTKISV